MFGLLALPACVASAPDEVGRREQAIIGGQAASPGDYPTVVALEDGPGSWFCTGTLIASEWVLTAAHCVDGAPATGMTIRLDAADVNDPTGGRVVAVASVHTHPDFDWSAWDDDIALLKLAAPVTDRAATPIHRARVVPATEVIGVGYGVADNMDGGGGLLRSVTKLTADCAGANDPGVSNDVLVCMDASDGRGSCFGDSGGPTFATVDGALVVAGVTSGGTGELCGAGWDLHTSVFAELPFLDAVLSATPPEPTPDPMEPGGPGGDGGPGHDGPADGGCTAGGGQGVGLVLVSLVGVLARRRRVAPPRAGGRLTGSGSRRTRR